MAQRVIAPQWTCCCGAALLVALAFSLWQLARSAVAAGTYIPRWWRAAGCGRRDSGERHWCSVPPPAFNDPNQRCASLVATPAASRPPPYPAFETLRDLPLPQARLADTATLASPHGGFSADWLHVLPRRSGRRVFGDRASVASTVSCCARRRDTQRWPSAHSCNAPGDGPPTLMLYAPPRGEGAARPVAGRQFGPKHSWERLQTGSTGS